MQETAVLARKRVAVCVALALEAGMAEHAMAQLEEVTVTAERREQTLQDVPVAVTAYSAEDLERFQIDDALKLDRFAPSLRVVNNVASATALNVNLRGTTEAGAAFLFSEPGVGLYQNGIFRRLAAGNIQLADIERIEILRGPQGTLFGRNTLAGAINIVTKRPDPDEETSGSVSAKVGLYERYSVRGSIYTPVSDTVAVSVAALWNEQREGFFTDVVSGDEVPANEFQGINAALRWRPNADFQLDASVYGSNNESDGQFGQPVFLTDGKNALPGDTDVAEGVLPNPNGPRSNSFSESESRGAELIMSYDLGSITLTSLTGYTDIDDGWAVDFTAGQFGSPDPAIRGTAGFFRDTAGDIKQFSQELQLQGEGDSFEYTVGLYYFTEETNQIIIDTAPALFFLPGIALPETYNLNTDSYAAYGQLRYAINDAWSLIVGGRYTIDEKKLVGAKEAGVFDTVVTPFESDEDFDEFTGRLGVEYSPADSWLAYLSFSQGYRPGTYNAGANALDIVNVLSEEMNDTLEFGLKVDLFDSSLRLNTAVFYQENSGLAVGQISGGNVQQDNVGESDLYGLELEGTWVPTDRFTARVALTLQDGEWLEVGDQPPNGILIDEELPGLQQYLFSIAADYTIPLRNGELTLTADVKTQDDFYATSAHRDQAANLTDEFTTLNAGISYMTNDGRHELALRGANLTDEAASFLTLNFGLNNTAVKYPINPLTVDLSYTYRF
jgi:iron complex outermembrane receptor protein